MECLGCKYDLAGLAERRCPECGRAFNPDDAATYGPARVEVRTIPDSLPIAWHGAVCAWPLAAFGLVHLARLAARLTLGRWPVPSADDPRGIGFAVDLLCLLAEIALVLNYAALFVSLAMLVAALSASRWRVGAVIALTAAIVWPIALLLFVADPGGAMAWFMD